MRRRVGPAMRMTIAAATSLALGASAARAQGPRNAAIVLELPASARALALGSAYAAAPDDDASLFYSPAQLATVSTPAAGASVQRYVEGSTLIAVSGAATVGAVTVALGVQSLDFGSVDEVVAAPGGGSGIPTGARVSAADLAVSLGAATRVRGLRIGATGKLVRQDVADASGSGPALDLGAAVDPWGRLTLAVALQNLGGDLELGGTRAPLPRIARVGAAVPVGRAGAIRTVLVAEASRVRGGDAAVAAGVEVAWQATPSLRLTGRAGAHPERDGNEASPLAFGGGVALRRLAIDYAYQDLDAFGGATHRFGARWSR